MPTSTLPPRQVPPLLQWAMLLAASLATAFVLARTGLPAALLLGPMIAGIAAGCLGASVRIHRVPFVAAQAVVGCLVAAAITPGIVERFADGWVLFLLIILAMNVISGLTGWLLSRRKLLPGTTAIWGSSPGGASAMMLLAEAFGADARLVAVMQYSRVIMVAAATSFVAYAFAGAGEAGTTAAAAAGAMEWPAFVQTLLLAGGGALLGLLLPIPAGPLLVPLTIGAVLNVAGVMEFYLPEWLLAASYALIGWNVGLKFTRPLIAHAAKAMPQIMVSNLVLIVACALLAWPLVSWLGVDPLTAFLATTPGGMDTVAIIAAASDVDLSFVMALQTARVALVLALGPPVARWLAGGTPKAGP